MNEEIKRNKNNLIQRETNKLLKYRDDCMKRQTNGAKNIQMTRKRMEQTTELLMEYQPRRLTEGWTDEET